MNSVAPVWDGNETWLVLGGGGLLAAFPLAYSIILPALYAPLIAMGPKGPSVMPPEHGTPTRPLSAAEEAGREALASGK